MEPTRSIIVRKSMDTKTCNLYSFGFLLRNIPGIGTWPSFSLSRLEMEAALGVGDEACNFSSSVIDVPFGLE